MLDHPRRAEVVSDLRPLSSAQRFSPRLVFETAPRRGEPSLAQCERTSIAVLRRSRHSNAVERFYRVLSIGEFIGKVFVHGGSLARWQDKKYTGAHPWTPPHWITTWNARTTKCAPDPKDYPLKSGDITYTADARDAFLRIAPTHVNVSDWSLDEQRQTGEYERVSAFDNPQAALEYGEGRTADFFRYVVFEGERKSALAPEMDVGGCTATVDKILLQPATRQEFQDWLYQRPVIF